MKTSLEKKITECRRSDRGDYFLLFSFEDNLVLN